MHCLLWVEPFKAFLFPLQLVLCRVTAEINFPLHYICSADYDIWSFGVIEWILDYFDNGALLKPALVGVVSRVLVMNKLNITKTRPYDIVQFFYGCNKDIFQIKKMRYFSLFFAQSIDCGYTLEPPY